MKLAFPDPCKRSLKAAAVMINIEELVPPSFIYPLPPPSTSEERSDAISFILKKETGIEYSRNELLLAHNVLMGSDYVQEQLKSDLTIEKIRMYLNQYRHLEPQSAFARTFSSPFLLPFQTICRQCQASLKVIFHARAIILFCTRVQPCLIYKADCFKCRLSYRISSIYSTDKRSIIVTPESQTAAFIHFSGAIVFAREILLSFSSHLIDGHASLSNFCSATIKTIRQLTSDDLDVPEPEQLARTLQTVWINFELSNFVFMIYSSTEFSFPSTMNEGRTKVKRKQSDRAAFVERNLDWIYHLFVVFWSNHDEVFGPCDSNNCSRTLTLDGHQKP